MTMRTLRNILGVLIALLVVANTAGLCYGAIDMVPGALNYATGLLCFACWKFAFQGPHQGA